MVVGDGENREITSIKYSSRPTNQPTNQHTDNKGGGAGNTLRRNVNRHTHTDRERVDTSHGNSSTIKTASPTMMRNIIDTNFQKKNETKI
jgi:hypothetical protein